MIKFKNRLTGTLMAVAPERKDEYLAAGHTLVNVPEPEAKTPTAEHTPVTAPAAATTAKLPAAKPAAKLSSSTPKKKSTAAKK